MLRLMIARLLGIILLIAISLAALGSASVTWAGMISMLPVGVLLWAILRGALRRGEPRASYCGFALFRTAYELAELTHGTWHALAGPAFDKRRPDPAEVTRSQAPSPKPEPSQASSAYLLNDSVRLEGTGEPVPGSDPGPGGRLRPGLARRFPNFFVRARRSVQRRPPSG